MPHTELQFYQETNGDVPLVGRLFSQPTKVQDKCLVKLERAGSAGVRAAASRGRLPAQDVYELRVRFQSVNYRMLYFFFGAAAVVASHGAIKEDAVPEREIELAIEHKSKVMANPRQHLFRPEE